MELYNYNCDNNIYDFLIENKILEELIPFDYILCKFEDAISITILKHNIFTISLFIYFETSTTLYLSNLYVDEKHRKQGYAKELINISENIASALDLYFIRLSSNINAFPYLWYKRIGFKDLSFDKSENLMYLIKNIKK